MNDQLMRIIYLDNRNHSNSNEDLSPIRRPRRPLLSLSPGLDEDEENQIDRDGSSQLRRSRHMSPEPHHSQRSCSVSFILLRYLAIATVVVLSYRQGCFLTHLDHW